MENLIHNLIQLTISQYKEVCLNNYVLLSFIASPVACSLSYRWSLMDTTTTTMLESMSDNMFVIVNPNIYRICDSAIAVVRAP